MTRFKCGKISPCLDKALKIERVRSIGVSGFVRFRVSGVSVFHQAQVAQLKKVRQKLPRRGTGNMGWAMLDHAGPQDFNMAEKYWKTTAVCRRTAWCGLGSYFGCPTMQWSFSFGTWSRKMILQDPVSETTSFYTISIHIQLWAHPKSIFHISLQGKQTTDSSWHSTTLAPICAAYWDLWNFYWSPSSFLFNVISIDLEEILTCSKCPSAMISREPVCHPYYGRWTGGLHNSFSGAFNTS